MTDLRRGPAVHHFAPSGLWPAGGPQNTPFCVPATPPLADECHGQMQRERSKMRYSYTGISKFFLEQQQQQEEEEQAI